MLICILVRSGGYVFAAVSVNFTSSNYTSTESGSTAVCVSKDAMTATNITIEITLTSVGSCGKIGKHTGLAFKNKMLKLLIKFQRNRLYMYVYKYDSITSYMAFHSIPPVYGDITPVIYTTVLVAGPVGAAACVNVTNDLWVGRSAFQVTITKVNSAGGIAKVGVPSRASVVIYNAGKI